MAANALHMFDDEGLGSFDTPAKAPVLGLSTGVLGFDAVQRKISGLMQLQPGWDSYGSRAISHDAAETALDAIGQLAFGGLEIPEIFPTPRGGIQAEWRDGARSLEVEFLSPTSIEVLFVDEASGEEEEMSLDFDIVPLFTYASRF